MKKSLIIMIALTLASCTNLNSNNGQLKKVTYESQTIDKTVVVENLAIAAQPTKSDLKDVKDEGYEIVVNLRNPNEFKGYNEAQYASELNLKYYNVPFFNSKKEINKHSLKMISKLIKDNKDKKIFIHCSSGNRASAWYLSHLYLEEGLSLEEAAAIARKTGLTKPGLEKRTIQILKE